VGQNRGRGVAILTPNELVLSFGGSYVCANFVENRSRNATARVPADGQTDTLTDANRFYNLSHAICYSYGTDKKYNLNRRKKLHNIQRTCRHRSLTVRVRHMCGSLKLTVTPQTPLPGMLYRVFHKKTNPFVFFYILGK